MQKILLLFSLFVFVIISACKKDKDDPTPFDVQYTNETPEKSKQKVEQNAIDFIDKLDQLSSTTAIEILMNLNELQSDGEKYAFTPATNPLISLSALNSDKSVSKVFESMKALSEMLEDDPINFSEMFDSIAGRYTWDFETEEFIESELEDQVIIEFPGLPTDLTNTAAITIDNFSVVEIAEPFEVWPENLDPELPATINIDLQYNEESIAGVSFEAGYQGDGLPTTVKVELYVDDFTFTTSATHKPFSSASWTNTLKFQNDILFEIYVAATGNWSEENIENNTFEETYTDEWESYTETEVHIEEIIKNGNAHVILLNLMVAGKVNFKALGDELRAIDEVSSEEEYAQAAVDALNKYAELVVIYRDSNKMIAKAEAYVESSYDPYYEEEDYYPSMRFVYADGSKVDVATYVDSELDGFFEALNDFIDKLNAEYNLEIEHVSTQG